MILDMTIKQWKMWHLHIYTSRKTLVHQVLMMTEFSLDSERRNLSLLHSRCILKTLILRLVISDWQLLRMPLRPQLHLRQILRFLYRPNKTLQRSHGKMSHSSVSAILTTRKWTLWAWWISLPTVPGTRLTFCLIGLSRLSQSMLTINN